MPKRCGGCRAVEVSLGATTDVVERSVKHAMTAATVLLTLTFVVSVTLPPSTVGQRRLTSGSTLLFAPRRRTRCASSSCGTSSTSLSSTTRACRIFWRSSSCSPASSYSAAPSCSPARS
eukprot:4781362-Prymnesium_polylepis.1